MLVVAYETSVTQPLPQVSEEGHSRSSPVLFEAPQLLMAYLFSLWYPARDRHSTWHPTHANQQIKIWRVWWPFMLHNKVTAVAYKFQSCVACAVSWNAILLKDKTIGHQWGSVFDKFQN